MEIRKTTGADLPQMLAIYERARERMRQTGNPRQWGDHWPPEALLREDVACGRSYACVDDGQPALVLGTFCYTFGPHAEPSYDRIEGAWEGRETYGVVHRLAVGTSGRGVGTLCLRWALAQCHNLRIDTHPDNKVMQHTLEGMGFAYRGIVHVVEDDDPRYAYELQG